MAYKNMKSNKQHAQNLKRLYSKKRIHQMTEKERDNLYMMLFNRKLPKKPK